MTYEHMKRVEGGQLSPWLPAVPSKLLDTQVNLLWTLQTSLASGENQPMTPIDVMWNRRVTAEYCLNSYPPPPKLRGGIKWLWFFFFKEFLKHG